jgi:hypothetical protein
MIIQLRLIKKVLFIQPISNEDDPNLKGSSSLLCIPDFSGAVSNGIHLSWIITVYFSFSPIALVVVNIIDSCTIPLWRIFWHCFTDLDNISVFVFGCLGYCEDCSSICIYTLFSYYAICAVNSAMYCNASSSRNIVNIPFKTLPFFLGDNVVA